MNNFSDVLKFLPLSISRILDGLPDEIKEDTYEIRLRVGKPVILYGKYSTLFINCDMTFSGVDYSRAYYISEAQFNETLGSICKYSVYSHQNDILNGFVTFGNGNRAGFAGKVVAENGRIEKITDFSSVNIRISSSGHKLPCEIRRILGDFSGILIVGPPCSGKTTILKSISELISSDYYFGFRKTVVVDERYEMQNLNAVNCDILSGYPKPYGIKHAVRTLSPHIIVCDEIISADEISEMAEGMYCGVKFIASMHLSSIEDIKKSPLMIKIIELNIFDYIVLLSDSVNAGEIKKIFRTEELKNDGCNCNSNYGDIGYCSVYDNL